MSELVADLFTTLDGFAAGEGAGPFFGYPGHDLDHWVRTNLEQPYLVLMGRVTYETMAALSASATDEIGTRMNELPKAVFSNTLQAPLTWHHTRLLSGDLRTEIQRLKQESDVPIRTVGSLSLVRSLIELGLVDRLRVTIFPLVLGVTGREASFAGYPDLRMELVGTQVLDSRVVVLEYAPLRTSADVRR